MILRQYLHADVAAYMNMIGKRAAPRVVHFCVLHYLTENIKFDILKVVLWQ